MTTKRKPYVREVSNTWWKKNDFYKRYMVREASCLATIWFCIVLLVAVVKLLTNDFGSFVGFMQNPLSIIANIVSLGLILYHAATLFTMTPEVMSFIVKGERLNPAILRNVFWGITAFVSLAALILVL